MASGRRDLTGSLLGLAVFLAGVALLSLTFKLAYDEFNVPHAQALVLVKDKPLDPRVTGGAAADIVIRLGVLLVMAIVGSTITNKGIGLYSGSLHPVDKEEKPKKPARETPKPAEPEPL